MKTVLVEVAESQNFRDELKEKYGITMAGKTDIPFQNDLWVIHAPEDNVRKFLYDYYASSYVAGMSKEEQESVLRTVDEHIEKQFL